MNDYTKLLVLLEVARETLGRIRAANTDEYGLLASADQHVVAALADIESDLK